MTDAHTGRQVAPDSGYAWVVLAASVGCNCLSGVLVYFVGVIQVELLHRYQDDVTTTAWAGSLYSSLQMLGAPLASWLVHRYSCRVSVVAGGLLLCIGFVTSSFATSVLQLIFTYGLIAGTGLALTYSPSLVIITFYFDKFRGLASGISVAGCAVGILSGSILTQALIDLYTLQGAFLLIAALGLQSCVFGMLYRPTHHEGSGGRRLHKIGANKSAGEQERRLSRARKAGEGSEKTPAVGTGSDKDPLNQTLRVSRGDDDDDDGGGGGGGGGGGEGSGLVDVWLSENGERIRERCLEEGKNISDSQQASSLMPSETPVQSSRSVCVRVDEEEEEKEGGGMESSNLLSQGQKPDRLSLHGADTERADVASETRETSSGVGVKGALSRKLQTCCGGGLGSLLKNSAFLLHCVSVCFAGLNMSGVYLHLPEYARTHGTRPTQAAALFVGVGIFSLVSRVGSGILLTSQRVNGFLLSVGLMGLCGLSSCLFPAYSASYAGQMAFSCLFGLSTGGFFTLINVLTVQLVEFRFLAAAYGMLIFVMGLGYVVGPPLAGMIVDSGGTYEHSFIFLGLAMFASALFDLLAKILHRRKSKLSD
ncbi:monocarboxylate transporter 12-like [Babylonia areolata]|uniref:monocarboxylate transporter 12-like n=1 Tax=Babylonia areolata TaxID=304850 RepID=UPI003FD28FC3